MELCSFGMYDTINTVTQCTKVLMFDYGIENVFGGSIAVKKRQLSGVRMLITNCSFKIVILISVIMRSCVVRCI